jgi:hypothetical protein
MYELAERFGMPFHIMIAWENFASDGALQAWILRQHGGFSVNWEPLAVFLVSCFVNVQLIFVGQQLDQFLVGIVGPTCRCATGKQTSSAKWIAVSKVRFWWSPARLAW